MGAPQVYELAHKADLEQVAGYAVVVGSGVLVCWADGVVEQSAHADLAEALRASYGDQYEVRLPKQAGVVRYAITETASGQPKGFAFCCPSQQVVLVWDDKTLEVWDKDAKLDAVVAQYAFQFTFECLDQ